MVASGRVTRSKASKGRSKGPPAKGKTLAVDAGAGRSAALGGEKGAPAENRSRSEDVLWHASRTAGVAVGALWGSLRRLLGNQASRSSPESTAGQGAKAGPKQPARRGREANLHPFAAALFEHIDRPDLEPTQPSVRAMAGETTSASGRIHFDLATRSNAFLFGALFDRMIDAEKAWAAPGVLADRLGHLDVRRISKLDPILLEKAIRGAMKGEALHRLPAAMARNLVATSKMLVRQYSGDAELIWPDGTPVRDLRTRLKELPGIGDKLADMVIAILARDYRKRFIGWSDTNIAVDRHVARVFLRTGLVTSGDNQRPKVSELKASVLLRAREIYPPYPVGLDLPTFFVGKDFCKALGNGGPQCGGCPVRKVCPQERLGWDVA